MTNHDHIPDPAPTRHQRLTRPATRRESYVRTRSTPVLAADRLRRLAARLTQPSVGDRLRRLAAQLAQTSVGDRLRRLAARLTEPSVGAPFHEESVESYPLVAEGDGVLLVRSATSDGVRGQLMVVADMVERHQLEPRFVIVAAGLSGRAPFDERPDLQEIQQALREGWCRWVGISDLNRIARDAQVSASFSDLLQANDARLYAAAFGRALDWNADRPLLKADALSA